MWIIFPDFNEISKLYNDYRQRNIGSGFLKGSLYINGVIFWFRFQGIQESWFSVSSEIMGSSIGSVQAEVSFEVDGCV